MTTYYMLPNCTSWGGSTAGWATSSGGVSTSASPGSADSIVIDANSGPARSILVVGGPSIASITATNCAPIYFTNSSFNIIGNVSNMSAMGTFDPSAGVVFNGTGTCTFTPPANGYIGSLEVGSSASVSLAGNLYITGALRVPGSSSGTPLMSFSANSYNVTCDNLTSAIYTNVTLNMGSGTWTITGSSGCWNAVNLTLNAQTSTLRFTNASASSKSFNGANKTYYNVWNDTSGGGDFIISGANTFNNYRASAGTLNSFQSGVTQTSGSFTIDGTAGRITVRSNTTSQATLTVTGGGKVYFDRCSISYINATPANSFFGRNYSVDAGNNTGWTFMKPNTTFFNFF